MEEEAIQAQSNFEMEEWEYLIQDPGNTRGRMTLLKQSLHVYWVMKRLLAKLWNKQQQKWQNWHRESLT